MWGHRTKEVNDMADKNNGETADIVVDWDALRRAALIWDAWGDEFLKHTGPLSEIRIAPGDFPAAERLKTIIHNRRDKLQENSEGIGRTFKAIAENLNLMATSYERGEDDIEAENERLNKLLRDVGQYLPEVANGTLPPDSAPTEDANQEAPEKEEKPAY